MRKSGSLLVLALVVSTLTGCGRRAPAVVQASSPVASPAAPADNSAAEREAAAREAAERAQREAEEARRRAELARVRSILATPIYFDFDSFEITSDSRQRLNEKIELVRTDPSIRLRIAGHADERGTTEYNIALGQRRAEAVKEYLAGYSIEGSRLQTTSFGKERPAVLGSNEAAWSQNRRAEIEIVAGPGGQ